MGTPFDCRPYEARSLSIQDDQRNFSAVEKAGGKVESALISGKVIFLSSAQKIECSIVEKMVKPLLRPEGTEANWTAYPEFHQTGLQSSGFLRAAITTYLPGKQPQWIETQKNKIANLLPEIVGTIMGAGPILIEWQREREESERRYAEEQERRRELQRLREIDEQRWTRFREKAVDWQEHAALSTFLAEVQKRLDVEGDIEVGGKLLSQWLVWARAKTDTLDPFRQGIAELLASITR
jgi:hypothetical protein